MNTTEKCHSLRIDIDERRWAMLKMNIYYPIDVDWCMTADAKIFCNKNK
jgi:hypothetical protein